MGYADREEEDEAFTSLENLNFKWCEAGGQNYTGADWDEWMTFLTSYTPNLRTLSFVDCFNGDMCKNVRYNIPKGQQNYHHELSDAIDCTGSLGNSYQLQLDISKFEHLQELTICEDKSAGGRFKGMVPFYALVDWHSSFLGGSQSLRRLRLEPKWSVIQYTFRTLCAV